MPPPRMPRRAASENMIGYALAETGVPHQTGDCEERDASTISFEATCPPRENGTTDAPDAPGAPRQLSARNTAKPGMTRNLSKRIRASPLSPPADTRRHDRESADSRRRERGEQGEAKNSIPALCRFARRSYFLRRSTSAGSSTWRDRLRGNARGHPHATRSQRTMHGTSAAFRKGGYHGQVLGENDAMRPSAS